jgi:gamma-glutamyltranspeptidase/glutathione hydrolase
VALREPLSFTWGADAGALVLTNPAPAIGGAMVRITLDLLSTALHAVERGSPRHMLALAAALAEAEKAREAGLPPDGELTPDASNDALGRVLQATRGTTHISVIDRDMNVASMTCSNGEGCGYIVPGTGIMLNNMLGEDDLIETGDWDFEPGVRMASMMTPTIVQWPMHGDRVLALGSGGSKRIRSAIAQVIANVVDLRLPLREAVERARMHWEDGRLQLEPGLGAEIESALRARFDVNLWERSSVYFGGVNAAAWPAEAAADSRRGGAAVIVTG